MFPLLPTASHCLVQATTSSPNHHTPSKQSPFSPLLSLPCSPQSSQRDPIKAFLSDFPLLLKSFQWPKNKIHLQFSTGPPPPVPACRPQLSSNTPQPPGLGTLVPLPWNTLGPGTRNPCLFPSFTRGSVQMENILQRSPG